ncbi:uncharacterized protein LOC121380263 [Gigantopelta aegis]|uniref:uncharacterized protein LOC121380263 n=1 Tax=Gigantopelta aegis TaxID=1735272 RepID=UPI001B889772|nr:uncharacterized protein LOC121380263 [Gigantopelta aegis]
MYEVPIGLVKRRNTYSFSEIMDSKIGVDSIGKCFYLAILFVLLQTGEARRYRYCAEGCCIHEYCAYHKICYPKTHCSFGCPDGTCENEICMPPKPCTKNSECGMANACTYNYNLGYHTCQYNLEIGSTLCVDRHGKSLLKPML